jgi:hypothetical protein
VKEIERSASVIIYNVVSSFDELVRRVTHLIKTPSQTHFITLFGCSFTAGKGVNDNETLNYFIAKKSSSFYPYNYGVNGISINNSLAFAQQPDFFTHIPEKTGLFIYTFIPSHIQRASGIYPEFEWMRSSPYFDVTEDNKVVRNGSWWSARPIYTATTKVIYDIFKNNILKGRLFPSPNDSDNEKFCRLARELKDTVEKGKPGSKFVFYLHPFFSGGRFDLEPCLNKLGVTFYRGNVLAGGRYVIPYDGHPNAVANEIIAQDIIHIAEKELNVKP